MAKARVVEAKDEGVVLAMWWLVVRQLSKLLSCCARLWKLSGELITNVASPPTQLQLSSGTPPGHQTDSRGDDGARRDSDQSSPKTTSTTTTSTAENTRNIRKHFNSRTRLRDFRAMLPTEPTTPGLDPRLSPALLSSPADTLPSGYRSPARHHQRTPSVGRAPVKETLDACTSYEDEEDGGQGMRINQCANPTSHPSPSSQV